MGKSKLPLIIGGCAVLLIVCCVASAAVIWINRDRMAGLLGQSVEGLPQTLETAVPPDVTLPTQPSSASTSGNPLLDALTKARAANKYRVDFAMVFGSMDKGQYKETPFIAFQGEIDGKNSHIISNGGLLSSMMTGSETGKVEITEVGSTEYMKGASSLFGVIKLDPNTWYIANQQTANTFADFAKPDEFSSWTGGTKISDMKKVRTELLDGQGCDVYLYDFKSIQNAALVGLLGTSQDKNAFGAIDRADINLWLCGDGYVHKYILDYEGHDAKDATQKGALKMNWHVWDVNSPLIVIQAPTGAKSMPTK